MGEIIYEQLDASPIDLQLINHEEGRVVKDELGAWEYQYHLKDHLGNVRVTFTTKPASTDTYLATYEPANLTAEMEVFGNIDPAFIDTYNAADHPMGDGENDVLKLNLTNKLASTMALTVQKGDVIDLGVWAYTDIDYNSFGNSSGQTALTSMIASVFGGISGGIGESGSIYSGIEQGLSLFGKSSKTDGTPSAHLNYLLFDKDFKPVDDGFAGITASGVQQYLTFTPLTIAESGYIFIFLSYGNDVGRVFFDDMKVEHTKNSKIVQQDDYYPFGLSFNSWQRGGSRKNDYLYNGKEMQDELDLGWMDYGARMYDGAIGRFMVQDVMADAFFDYLPYSYTANNPLLFVDPTGNYFVIWYEDEDGNQKSFRFDGSNGADAPDNDYVVSFLAAYHYNVNNGGGDALAEIACDTEIGIGVANTDGESQYNNGVIHWNSTLGLKTENNEVLSPATVLEHEGFHGLRDKKYHDEYYKDDMTKDATWGDLDEKKAIMGNESKTARANGETKRKQTRTSHSGSELVITQGSTSNKVNNNGTYEFYMNLANKYDAYGGTYSYAADKFREIAKKYKKP